MAVRFAPIDLAAHAATCIRFRKDASAISFNHEVAFFGGDDQGVERYLGVLRRRIEQDPWSCVHLWHGETIIGQMEMGPFKLDPAIGHVNLYYLVPEWRGKGISAQLDAYANTYLAAQGFAEIQLCVSPTNLRAIRYYEKHGWRDAGPREDDPSVRFMRKRVVVPDAD